MAPNPFKVDTIQSSKKNSHPIFYDHSSKRWKLLRGVGILFLCVLGTLVGLGIGSVVLTSPLPDVHLPVSASFEPRLLPDAHLASASPPANHQIAAFYVNWDPLSFLSLQQHAEQIKTLIPEWLQINKSDGSLIFNDIDQQQRVLKYIRERHLNTSVLPLLSNFDASSNSWLHTEVESLLSKPAASQNLITQLIAYLQANQLAGVEIDLEELSPSGVENRSLFLHQLHQQLQVKGLKLYLSASLAEAASDYVTLLKDVEYLVVNFSDEHWSGSDPGPIASQPWVQSNLQWLSGLPANQLIISLGNYGYDWTDSSEVTTLSYPQALARANQYGQTINLESPSLNPFFSYTDQTGKSHKVWFLDAVTLFNQFKALRAFPETQFALARLGTEDPAIWSLFRQPASWNPALETSLSHLTPSYDLDYQGQGEVIKVTSDYQIGKRTLEYSQEKGLIIAEAIKLFPTPYTISQWGHQHPKQLALTFDDGPSALYTDQILDILRERHIPATFFLIGSNASHNPDIVQEMYQDGHEIGNHTLLHSNVSRISSQQLQIEIKATDRIMQSLTGHRSLLFRPPYAVDVEPSALEQIRPLIQTSQMGYYTVAMHIDPNDWRPGKTKQQIIQDVLSQVHKGEGEVILLHDGGGDRSQTVAALPVIISTLEREGYSFVPVSELMGLNREAVMPTISGLNHSVGVLNKISMTLVNGMGSLVYFLFILSVSLGLLRLLFTASLAWRQARLRRRTYFSDRYRPAVCVIVPAFNEENVILQTVASILDSEYSHHSILVVDDGSHDLTYSLLQEKFGHNRKVRLLTKVNAGKAAAINYAVRRTRAEVIITIDADTQLHPQAIGKLARHFADKSIGAVAGNAKVGNRLNLLTRWQALEYIMGQNLDRRAFDFLNCIGVVPGAIGAWRRQVLMQAGGFAQDTLAEDTDLTVQILRLGHRIIYEDQAIAFTEAPDCVHSFLGQRFRWVFGTLQAVWKHRQVLFKRRYRSLGLVGLPNLLIFQVILPLLGPLMDLLLLLSLVALVWQRYQHPETYSLDPLKKIAIYYLFFFILELLTGFIAFYFEKKENRWLMIWLPLQRFFYRQMLYLTVIRSVLSALRGHRIGWGSIERKATVQAS